MFIKLNRNNFFVNLCKFDRSRSRSSFWRNAGNLHFSFCFLLKSSMNDIMWVLYLHMLE